MNDIKDIKDVKNDERYFVKPGENKAFSTKLSGEEYQKEMIDSDRYYLLEPIHAIESVENYLIKLIKVKHSLEIHIKDYLRECTRNLYKPYDFLEIKKELDAFEIQLKDLDKQIEKRKALMLLKSEFETKQD
jgi:hypothetical protein